VNPVTTFCNDRVFYQGADRHTAIVVFGVITGVFHEFKLSGRACIEDSITNKVLVDEVWESGKLKEQSILGF